MAQTGNPDPKHPLRDTLVAAIALGMLFSVTMMASGLVLVGIVLVFWLPYSLVVIIRRPDRRRTQAAKIGIWLSMVVFVLGFHVARQTYVRHYADSVVQKLEEFRSKEGRFPDSLDEVGVAQAEFKRRLGPASYSNRNHPRLYYQDTMMIFRMWSYDFDKREWLYEGD